MGRMLDALRGTNDAANLSEPAAKASSEPVGDDPLSLSGEEIPFIEVGPRKPLPAFSLALLPRSLFPYRPCLRLHRAANRRRVSRHPGRYRSALCRSEPRYARRWRRNWSPTTLPIRRPLSNIVTCWKRC
jgi:hypothetical protein